MKTKKQLITERKQIEAALRESEARYGALVEGSMQGICIVREGRRAEEALTPAQAELERRVVQRTAALHEANARLVQEIAERTRSEQALRVSEERWRSLVEDAADTTGICATRFVTFSQRKKIFLTSRLPNFI